MSSFVFIGGFVKVAFLILGSFLLDNYFLFYFYFCHFEQRKGIFGV